MSFHSQSNSRILPVSQFLPSRSPQNVAIASWKVWPDKPPTGTVGTVLCNKNLSFDPLPRRSDWSFALGPEKKAAKTSDTSKLKQFKSKATKKVNFPKATKVNQNGHQLPLAPHQGLAPSGARHARTMPRIGSPPLETVIRNVQTHRNAKKRKRPTFQGALKRADAPKIVDMKKKTLNDKSLAFCKLYQSHLLGFATGGESLSTGRCKKCPFLLLLSPVGVFLFNGCQCSPVSSPGEVWFGALRPWALWLAPTDPKNRIVGASEHGAQMGQGFWLPFLGPRSQALGNRLRVGVGADSDQGTQHWKQLSLEIKEIHWRKQIINNHDHMKICITILQLLVGLQFWSQRQCARHLRPHLCPPAQHPRVPTP